MRGRPPDHDLMDPQVLRGEAVKIPGFHLVPTMSNYMRMSKADRDELMLWLKRYFDGLLEADNRTKGK